MNLWALLNLFEFFSLNSPYCVPGSIRFRWVKVSLDPRLRIDIQQMGGMPNDDGIVRNIPMVMNYSNELYPSLRPLRRIMQGSLKLLTGVLNSWPEDRMAHYTNCT